MRFLRAICLFTLSLMLFAVPALAQDAGTHTVTRGDTLYRIAQQYNIPVDALIAANNITNPSRILAGSVLIIPGYGEAQPQVVAEASAAVAAPAAVAVTHVIARGETLNIIARDYGVTVEELMRQNNIANPNYIFSGQSLQIYTSNPVLAASAPPAVQAAATTTYVVRPGEYLSQIARNFGISWTTLAAANNITDPNRVEAGTTLVIPNGAVAINSGLIDPNSFVPPGAHIGVGREVVVVLSTQMTYAYENGILLRSVRVSTGLPATPTVQGDYKVYAKYESQLMAGPGYYLPGVPWIMYFYQGYALHGAYWHTNWGNPMSHGCVNMPIEESRWFYDFTTIGTPVHVQWA